MLSKQQREEIKEEFLRRFFEPTFVDLRPYDSSYKDEEKIDYWLKVIDQLLEQSNREVMEKIRKNIEQLKMNERTIREYNTPEATWVAESYEDKQLVNAVYYHLLTLPSLQLPAKEDEISSKLEDTEEDTEIDSTEESLNSMQY